MPNFSSMIKLMISSNDGVVVKIEVKLVSTESNQIITCERKIDSQRRQLLYIEKHYDGENGLVALNITLLDTIMISLCLSVLLDTIMMSLCPSVFGSLELFY